MSSRAPFQLLLLILILPSNSLSHSTPLPLQHPDQSLQTSAPPARGSDGGEGRGGSGFDACGVVDDGGDSKDLGGGVVDDGGEMEGFVMRREVLAEVEEDDEVLLVHRTSASIFPSIRLPQI